MVGDGLAEWLSVHGMTADQMLTLIDGVVPKPGQAPQPDLTPSAEDIWTLAAEALAVAFPQHIDLINLTHDKTGRNLSADPARFPRAFTLWEPPHVSVPVGGGIEQMLTVAHEFGHACQIWACRISDGQATEAPPPILRELAACLAELALLDHLPRAHPALVPAARAQFDAATWRTLTLPRQRLEMALRAGQGRYRYDWNYPPARRAALKLWAQSDRSRRWTVFDGSLRLASVLD